MFRFIGKFLKKKKSYQFFLLLLELSKARLSSLVLLTTLVGFLIGWNEKMNYFLLASTMIGTALTAASASAFNQWIERRVDALMPRTSDRPIPSERIEIIDVILFALFSGIVGLLILYLFVNSLTAYIACITLIIYLLMYTPLKKYTDINTLFGAVPGALPPLMGYTAATDQINFFALILFFILWFWQIPHFLAIAWIYRDQYKSAGFCMLPSRDLNGKITAYQTCIYSAALLVVSLIPTLIGMASLGYFITACILSTILFSLSVYFLFQRSMKAARYLFFGSIIYLPILLIALVLFKQCTV